MLPDFAIIFVMLCLFVIRITTAEQTSCLEQSVLLTEQSDRQQYPGWTVRRTAAAWHVTSPPVTDHPLNAPDVYVDVSLSPVVTWSNTSRDQPDQVEACRDLLGRVSVALIPVEGGSSGTESGVRLDLNGTKVPSYSPNARRLTFTGIGPLDATRIPLVNGSRRVFRVSLSIPGDFPGRCGGAGGSGAAAEGRLDMVRAYHYYCARQDVLGDGSLVYPYTNSPARGTQRQVCADGVRGGVRGGVARACTWDGRWVPTSRACRPRPTRERDDHGDPTPDSWVDEDMSAALPVLTLVPTTTTSSPPGTWWLRPCELRDCIRYALALVLRLVDIITLPSLGRHQNPNPNPNPNPNHHPIAHLTAANPRFALRRVSSIAGSMREGGGATPDVGQEVSQRVPRQVTSATPWTHQPRRHQQPQRHQRRHQPRLKKLRSAVTKLRGRVSKLSRRMSRHHNMRRTRKGEAMPQE